MSNNIQKITWPGWETVRLIGRGSFGTVYEIQRRVFDDTEKAALKVISIPQNPGDIDEMYNDGYDDVSISKTLQDYLKSIVAEYSMMRKLDGCPNIVNCDDLRYVQHEDGFGWDVFIRMELLTPLVKVLPAEIPEEMVIQIAKDMCCALKKCKEQGIIHRDIKPQNIFLSPRGEYKLGDFGIAKTVEKTMGGTKIGTYKYMAPEVYNNQPYGSAADIYSLGLVLYWLLNERRMPFMPLPPTVLRASDEENSRARRLSGEKLPEPKNGSAELKRIVLKACAFDPKERFVSAQDMLDVLANYEYERAVGAFDPGYTCWIGDTEIKMGSVAAPILKSLGEPIKCWDAWCGHCAYEYSAFTIYTELRNGVEFLDGLSFNTEDCATSEGVRLGSSREEVEVTYGAEYYLRCYGERYEYGMTRGGSGLFICIGTNNVVESIKYERIYLFPEAKVEMLTHETTQANKEHEFEALMDSECMGKPGYMNK